MKKVLPLLVLFVAYGCKKESNTKELLTKSWKLNAITQTISGTNTPLNLSTCEADRTWTYKKDGSFLNELSASCTQAGFDDTWRGAWSLTNNNKTLKIYSTGTVISFTDLEFEIVTLTNSKLVMRRTGELGGGGGFGGGGDSSPREFLYEFIAK
jgi:hypothetical protein